MGYRSEIAIKIYGSESAMELVQEKYREIFNEASTETKDGIGWVIEDAAKVINGWITGGTTNPKCFSVYQDSIKWYEDSGYVQFFTELMDYAEEAGVYVEFIRIGEDAGDIEINRFGENLEYLIDYETRIVGA